MYLKHGLAGLSFTPSGAAPINRLALTQVIDTDVNALSYNSVTHGPGQITASAGTDRLMVITFGFRTGGDAVTGMTCTFGSQSATLVESAVANTSGGAAAVFYIKDADIPTGAQTLTVNIGGATLDAVCALCWIAEYENVDQTTPIVSQGSDNFFSIDSIGHIEPPIRTYRSNEVSLHFTTARSVGATVQLPISTSVGSIIASDEVEPLSTGGCAAGLSEQTSPSKTDHNGTEQYHTWQDAEPAAAVGLVLQPAAPSLKFNVLGYERRANITATATPIAASQTFTGMGDVYMAVAIAKNVAGDNAAFSSGSINGQTVTEISGSASTGMSGTYDMGTVILKCPNPGAGTFTPSLTFASSSVQGIFIEYYEVSGVSTESGSFGESASATTINDNRNVLDGDLVIAASAGFNNTSMVLNEFSEVYTGATNNRDIKTSDYASVGLVGITADESPKTLSMTQGAASSGSISTCILRA